MARVKRSVIDNANRINQISSNYVRIFRGKDTKKVHSAVVDKYIEDGWKTAGEFRQQAERGMRAAKERNK